MKILFAVLAILGTVLADCGCLKCSKHLTVAGAVPGAPGQAPIKVIYRCDSGCPSDTGHLSGYPIIHTGTGYPVGQPCVQVPVKAPEQPSPHCGQEYPVLIESLYRPPNIAYGPVGSDYVERSYFESGYPEYEEEYGTVSVQVQAPVQPAHRENCKRLQGLTTSLDRVIVPCPPFSLTVPHGMYEHRHKHEDVKPVYEQVIPTCCGPIKCPLISSHYGSPVHQPPFSGYSRY